MKYYFEKLQRRVDKYKNKYQDKPRKAAFKLFWWSFKCLFKRYEIDNDFVKIEIQKDKKLNIAFVCGGGIGDIIISALYISKFIKKIDCPYNSCLFVGQSVSSIKALLNQHVFAENIYKISELNEQLFDIVIRFEVQFPNISYIDEKRVFKKSKFLKSYYNSIMNFNTKYSSIVGLGEKTYKQQAFLTILNKTRITGMDVGDFLQLKHDDKIKLTLPMNGREILKKYDLIDKPFITIQRGVDVMNKSSESTKLWSVENYEILSNLIKEKYPTIKIVQLGVSKNRCINISNVDLNLIEKTSFSEVLWILKNSLLHIDCEGGMVHLRHFLSAKTSIVLFGPTSPITRGYKENINIRTTKCNCQFCEWLIGENWQTYCLNTKNTKSLCMNSITPQTVFNQVDNFISNKF